jgi:hypothetical protein
VRQLLVRVGLIVLIVWLGSCAAGAGAARVGATGALGALRDVGIILLAIVSLVMAAIWAAVYLASAWAVGRFGDRAIGLVRRTATGVQRVERGIDAGMERVVVRPLGRMARLGTSATTYLRLLVAGRRQALPAEAAVSRWRLARERLRSRPVGPPAGQPLAADGGRRSATIEDKE